MDIRVTVRQNTNPESKIAAFADVTLQLPEGRIELKSFTVFKPKDENGEYSVAPSASKGDKKFFPHYIVAGDLRDRINAAILSRL
jgi:hypothetical protein